MNGLTDKHILVVGLGKTGESAVRFLEEKGAQVSVIDNRENPPALHKIQAEFPGVSVYTGGFCLDVLNSVDELLVSPGIDLREPLLEAARARNLPINGDIEWFARYVNAPVVAITGSNGKSTVTALLSEMASAAGVNVAVGANFGTPALDLIDSEVELYVLELSSFQLELTHSLAPRAACVLNVSADHIDRHGSIEHYAQLKARIFNGAEVAVINRDDPLVSRMQSGSAKALTFGKSVPFGPEQFGLIEAQQVLALATEGQALIPVTELKIRGQHNYMNALAALALGHAVGLERGAMLQALRDFAGLPHRCQWVASIAGVDWVNDSKGTNVGALLASLDGLPGPIVLLAGGQAKGGDFHPVGPAMARKGRMALLFGADADMIERVIDPFVPVVRVADLNAAVSQAAQAAVAGDTVLLSPGCASLDMFRDYADRGEQFTAAVLGLAA